MYLLTVETTINEIIPIQSFKRIVKDVEEAMKIIDKTKEELFDDRQIIKAQIYRLNLVISETFLALAKTSPALAETSPALAETSINEKEKR